MEARALVVFQKSLDLTGGKIDEVRKSSEQSDSQIEHYNGCQICARSAAAGAFVVFQVGLDLEREKT